MNLSSAQFGPFSLYTIETGRFKLDGGAMFGVVPKTLWSRQIPADEKNRIPMAMRCLLIQSKQTNRTYLVDNGIGTKFDEKFNKIYGVDFGKGTLEESLSYHGFGVSDITDIIFTHLHFDHCGGTTYFDDSGALQHTFPNATYHVMETHWRHAIDPNAREKASFLKENIKPLAESDRLNLIEEGHNYEEGLSHVIVNGHTIGQQLPLVTAGDQTLVYTADLLPTTAHVPLPWVMAYDMYPAETLLEKERFLNNAEAHNWLLYFEHDAETEIGVIQKESGKFSIGKKRTLTDI